MTVWEVYQVLDQAAPFSLAMDFDNVGLLVGAKDVEVTGILTALDITLPVIEEARERGMNLIVSHHPVIFASLRRLTPDTPAYWLCRYGISAICSHTNLDIALGGVNDVLCELLALQGMETARPENLLRTGTLPRGMTPPEFAYYCKSRLNLSAVRYSDGGQNIRRVAVCGGSGGSMLDTALNLGCQAIFTGELKHDQRLYGMQMGLTIVDAGHFASENVVIPRLIEILRKAVGDSVIPVVEARANVCPETVI